MTTDPRANDSRRSPALQRPSPGALASKRRRTLALRIGGSILILGALFLVLPAKDLADSIRALPAMMWPAAIGIYLVFHLLGVTKWSLLINTAGAELPFRRAARAYYWGLFGNTFLPSIVGGDVVRAGMAMRSVRSKGGLIFGSLIDRLQDVAGLGVVAGIGALLSPRALDAQSRGVFVALGLLLAGVVAVGAAALLLFPVRRLGFRFRRKLVHVRRAIMATARRPSALASAF